MPVINYQAKRDIQLDGVSVNASDLFCYDSSAAAWVASNDYSVGDYVEPTAGDNGFTYEATSDSGSSSGSEPTWPNTDGGTVVDGGITWTARQKGLIKSSTTDLSSFTAGNWIKIVGFTDDQNNEWFEVVSSAAGYIEIDYDQNTLFEEPSGTIVGIVGYVRGYNQNYDIEFYFSSKTPQRQTDKSVRRAISGRSTTILRRRDKFWSLSTSGIHNDNLDQWDEFFASVSEGETFTMDLDGTVASPTTTINCELIGDETYTRIGDSDHFQISFKVRVR